jgi:hypothetical protein
MASTRHGDAEYLRGLATLKRREALFDRAHHARHHRGANRA